MTKKNVHPSTRIPADTIEEIAYRVYLRRLDPPMTPEQSLTSIRTNQFGKIMADDVIRRRNAKAMEPIMRDALRVLVDMGMVFVPNTDDSSVEEQL